ncbi:hypothetical protein AGC46_002851 [Salmonella enterica subsp. enterica serovar Uganda]|nr:hypothetical protein [Salmonella enterica subsp. enterica serovar Uganda]
MSGCRTRTRKALHQSGRLQQLPKSCLVPLKCNFAFFSGLIGAQFWAERAQPKSPELDAKLLVSC